MRFLTPSPPIPRTSLPNRALFCAPFCVQIDSMNDELMALRSEMSNATADMAGQVTDQIEVARDEVTSVRDEVRVMIGWLADRW